jgi:hypothetical protein
MTDDPIPSLAEAMAEIRRLRARIAEMETAAAVTLGTLAQPTDDEPARYTHDLPPSAPPHDE